MRWIHWVDSAVILLLTASCLGCSAAPADPAPTHRPLDPAPSDPAPSDPAPSDPAAVDEAAAADFEPPPYDYDALSEAEHDDVCGHTAMPPSADPCSADTDCRICHDGSNCGIPANLETLRTRGAECRRDDAAECEYAAVRCCSGRCRVVSH